MTNVLENDSSPAGQLGLADRQLRAIDAFNRARRTAEAAAAAAARSRETRMDASRQFDVIRREHAALIARVHEQLRLSGEVLRESRGRTAVIAHRSPWFAGKVADLLTRHGVRTLSLVDNGADAVGATVAEQPDLVLVEDTLAMLPGDEVVREVRQFSPRSVIAAQTTYADGISAMLTAGATTAFTRRVPPAEAVDRMLAHLTA